MRQRKRIEVTATKRWIVYIDYDDENHAVDALAMESVLTQIGHPGVADQGESDFEATSDWYFTREVRPGENKDRYITAEEIITEAGCDPEQLLVENDTR